MAEERAVGGGTIGSSLGTLMALNPATAGFFLESLQTKMAAKDFLASLKEAGFDLTTPSGVVLEGLLKAGTLSPERAMNIYIALQNAQASAIELQAKWIDLKLKEAQIRNLDARTLSLLQQRNFDETKLVRELIDSEFNPSLERIQAEREQIFDLLQGNQLTARVTPDKIAQLEARLHALDQAAWVWSRIREMAVFEAQDLVQKGMNPLAAVRRGAALATAQVLEEWADLVEQGAIMLPDTKQVKFGRQIGMQFVDVFQNYVNPQFGRQMAVVLGLASSGVIPYGITEGEEEDEGGMSMLEAAGYATGAVAAGWGAKKTYDWIKRRRKASGFDNRGRKIETSPKNVSTKMTPSPEPKAKAKPEAKRSSPKALPPGSPQGFPYGRALPKGAIPQPARRRDIPSGYRYVGSSGEPIPQPPGAPLRKALPAGTPAGESKPLGQAPRQLGLPLEAPSPKGQLKLPFVEQAAEHVRKTYGLQDNSKKLLKELQKLQEVMERQARGRPGFKVPKGKLNMPGLIGVGMTLGSVIPMLIEELRSPKKKEEEEYWW